MIGCYIILRNMNNVALTNQGIGSVLITLAFVSCLCWATCPTSENSQALEVDEFAGEWYMVAGTPTSGKNLSDCGHVVITQTSPNTFSGVFTAVSRRNQRPVTFVINGTVGNDTIGTWQLQGSERKDPRLGPFIHRVVASNYTSHVLMIVCSHGNPDLPRDGYAIILSREKSLVPTVLVDLKDIISFYFERDSIDDVDHSNCSSSLPSSQTLP